LFQNVLLAFLVIFLKKITKAYNIFEMIRTKETKMT